VLTSNFCLQAVRYYKRRSKQQAEEQAAEMVPIQRGRVAAWEARMQARIEAHEACAIEAQRLSTLRVLEGRPEW